MMFHLRSSYRWGLALGLVLGLGSAGLGLATTLSRFEADYAGSAVRVAWAVSTETDLTSFSLSRKLPGEADFKPLGSLVPAGHLRYAYLDTSLRPGRTGLMPSPVQYRLTLRSPGPATAYATAVPGSTNPIQRAWSTIKAMFR